MKGVPITTAGGTTQLKWSNSLKFGKIVGFGDWIIKVKVGQNSLLPPSYFDTKPKGHLTLIYAYLFSDLM